jgi:prolyl oligopeptidase
MKQIFIVIFSLYISSCGYIHNKSALTFDQNPTQDDGYVFLENLQDDTILNWLNDQNVITDSLLNSIENRDVLSNFFIENGNTQKISLSFIKVSNGNYFYVKKEIQNTFNSVCMRNKFDGTEIEIFKSSEFIWDNQNDFQITYLKPSYDGNHLAIGLSKNGIEISKIIFYDILEKRTFGSTIENVWPNQLGGINWMPDDSGVIYTSIPIIDRNSADYLKNTKLMLLTFEANNQPEKFIELVSSVENSTFKLDSKDIPLCNIPDSKSPYVFFEVGGVNKYKDIYYSKWEDLKNNHVQWKLLFTKQDQIKNYFEYNNEIYFISSKFKNDFEIYKRPFNTNSQSKILVKEEKGNVITEMKFTKSGLFFVKTKNGVSAELFKLQNNKIHKIVTPRHFGTLHLTNSNCQSDDLWINAEGWLDEDTSYYYDVQSSKFEVQNLTSKIISNYNPNDYVIEEIEVTSYDQTKVPLSIIYKKGTIKKGYNPLILEAYGSYGISLFPGKINYMMQWIDLGGIYAIAHVRGGGEKGEDWYKGGTKSTKPNTWKDYIACTEFLIENKYTEPQKIVGYAASAGGICVGRAVTERPDLYKAVITISGLFNTLRSEFGPNGENNTKEFGSVKDSIESKSLFEMDAYHHIKKGVSYPAALLYVGMNDARVPVWHSAKFYAKMLDSTASDNPILLMVNNMGGHSVSNENQTSKMMANLISFALWQTGHPDYQPTK